MQTVKIEKHSESSGPKFWVWRFYVDGRKTSVYIPLIGNEPPTEFATPEQIVEAKQIQLKFDNKPF